MALTARQQRFYTDTIDLYKPIDIKTDPTRLPQDVRYPDTPTYAGVLCHREAKVESTEPGALGRVDIDNMMTMDEFHLDAAQEIGGNWAIQFKTAGHPDNGTWFLAQGDTRVTVFRANKQSLMAKRITKPRGVS